jgi:hypothetical protein
MSVTELAERLPPRFSTLRDLFAHSGNRCAFRSCDRVLVNHKGQWVGEVCHIRAALPGGERFDGAMTNEERRHRDNLMLMCHDHHVETDDVNEFTVEVLLAVKAEHEAQFAGELGSAEEKVLERAVQDVISPSLEDYTDRVVLRLPQTLIGLYEHIGEGDMSEEVRQGSIDMLVPTLERLRRLPVDTRAVFAILVDRVDTGRTVTLPLHELEGAMRMTADELYPHVETLGRYDVAYMSEEDGFERPAYYALSANDVDGWEFWGDFRSYCQERALSPKKVINELTFDVLD